VPLRRGQISTREINNGLVLTQALKAGEPVTIDHINGPYSENSSLRKLIEERGV